MAIRDITKYTRPKYIESPYSVDTYVGILKTPTLSIDTNNKLRLSWTNIDSNTQLYELEYSYNSGSWEIYDNPISTATTYDLPDNLPDGTYKFRIRATATIIDSNFHSHDFYSAWSNETAQFTVKTLKKCTIESVNENSQYYIGNVDPDADYYILTITKDNSSSQTIQFNKNKIPTSANPYNLNYDEAGIYVLTITAYNNNEYLFHNATSSNTKTYSVIKLEIPVLTDDKFNKDNPQVDWNAITNANGYAIYLNNIEINSSYAGTTYNFKDDITPDVLNYSAKIKAVRSGQAQYANPKYLNSEFSNEIKFGTLPNPILGLSSKPGQDNIIEILNKDKFINAEEFEVYDIKQGKEVLIIKIPATEAKYILESLTPRTFNIKMKAISSSKNIINSGFSNLITYSFVQLAKPSLSLTNSENANLVLSWKKIQNADYYELYNKGELINKVFGTTITVKLPIGYNSLYVIAKSNFKKYLPSSSSNTITHNQDSDSEYVIQIDGKSYNMVLPFTFNETLDESMDTATAITVPLDIKEPFEAYSDAEIWINSKNPYKPLPGFPKYMIIAQDDVKEIQLGNTSKYQHNLNLIERTKLLETELMPDFSITQPMEYAKALNELEPAIVDPDYGNNSIFNGRDTVSKKRSLWTNRTFFSLGPVSGVPVDHAILSLKEESIIGKLSNSYYTTDKQGNGVKIELPQETSLSFDVFDIKYSAPDYKRTYVYYDSLKDLGVHLIKTYKYRKHNSSYDEILNDANYQEHVIETRTDGKSVSWNIKDLPFGKYDIILEIEISDADWNKVKEKALYQGKGKLNFMYDDNMFWGYLAKYFWETTEFADISKLKKFRIVWGSLDGGINLLKQTSTTEKEDEYKLYSKNIWDGLEKSIKILYPLKYGSSPKYKINPKFKTLFDNKFYESRCPELKFQGGKSLYEVLLTFGRLFYGIPRLGCYNQNGIYDKNCITFDVLDSSNITQSSNDENSAFIDKNNIETMTSSIENHSTGYVSNISNLITNEYYSEFPAGDTWISARSGSESDALANKDNMAIVLDKPIYRLVSVLVKNYSKTNPERYVDIYSFVYDETNFNSLNNDQLGKGLAIYYKQGDNKILGLGNIPEASESQAAMGIDPTEYIIQRIIYYSTGIEQSSQNDPNNFLYKVIYVPYVDGRVFTEQTNIANLKNTTYKNLNQEDNVVYDKYFGKSAQTQVERLGNNSINKSYITTNINELPKIGQIKEFDNYKYYADEIRYQYNNENIVSNVNYSKNFNKINERIGIDAQYRLYRIALDEYINRSININTYCYLSKNRYDIFNNSIYKTNSNLLYNLKNSINDGTGKCSPHKKPDTFYIRNFKNNDELLQYNKYESGESFNVPCSVIPAAYNTFANSVMFSGKFIDNFSAGIKVEKPYNKQKVQQDVRYVDNNGENQIMGITLCNQDNEKLNISSDSYPEAPYISTPYTLNNALYSEKIEIDKDNKECINLVYQLHFQTFDKNITIGKGLINNLYYDAYRINVSDSSKKNSPCYVFFKGDVSKQSNIESNQYQRTTPVETELHISSGAVHLKQKQTAKALQEYDGYALVLETGDILFSVKEKIKKDDIFTIPDFYFNFSDNKLKYQPK